MTISSPLHKIIVIVGPTASGKSDLAINLAKKHNGEILSVDSRQIYKGLDIGSGKVTDIYDITHHGLDIASPKKIYSLTQFQKYASKTIKKILTSGKLPILVGGSSFWMDSVVYGHHFPEVKPNTRLRRQLTKLTLPELQQQLLDLDSDYFQSIDSKNPVRLIRAIEVAHSGVKPKKLAFQSQYDALWIGLKPEPVTLEKRIKTRLTTRLQEGLVEEVKTLHEQTKLSWEKLCSFGLEYRFVSMYLQKQLSETEMFELLFTAIKQYAKRQMTWWKRNKHINWIADPQEADAIVASFFSLS